MITYNFYTLQGICDGLRGPCLLDLTELLKTTVDEISNIFIISVFASAMGAFSCK